MDVFTKEKRSEVMSRIRSKNTKPEIIVRSLLHTLGYRFRIHRCDLPGMPDIVLPRYKSVIFVHGCFWHGHNDSMCPIFRIPKTNSAYWKKKILYNMCRDNKDIRMLGEMGWKVLIIWECELRDLSNLRERLNCSLQF